MTKSHKELHSDEGTKQTEEKPQNYRENKKTKSYRDSFQVIHSEKKIYFIGKG